MSDRPLADRLLDLADHARRYSDELKRLNALDMAFASRRDDETVWIEANIAEWGVENLTFLVAVRELRRPSELRRAHLNEQIAKLRADVDRALAPGEAPEQSKG